MSRSCLPSVEIEQQLKEAQAKVDAAEARAAKAEVDATEATARAVAAEGRAGKAEALNEEYEEKLTSMCNLNDKLDNDLKKIKSQLAKKPSATQRKAARHARLRVRQFDRRQRRHLHAHLRAERVGRMGANGVPAETTCPRHHVRRAARFAGRDRARGLGPPFGSVVG